MNVYKGHPGWSVEAAIRLTKPLEITNERGTYKGQPGDWLLVGTDGRMALVDDASLRSQYWPDDRTGMLGQAGMVQVWVPVQSTIPDYDFKAAQGLLTPDDVARIKAVGGTV